MHWGLPHLNHYGEGQNLHYFLLGDDMDLDAIDRGTLHQKTTHKRRKNSQLQDLQRQ